MSRNALDIAADDHHAGRRVRELYRYFQPEHPSQPPLISSYFDSWVNSTSWAEDGPVPRISAASASTPHPLGTPGSTPRVPSDDGLVLGNPNRTLTSFAQLAALRLNAERVLISVSDRESQFVLAESTQSTGLDATVRQAEKLGNDNLWTGCATVAHAWSMCKNELGKATVALPPSTRNPSQYRFLVVDDMSRDDRYKTLPFVQGDPHFRFYAGTPLTTETNINIGCLFVLDTQPRGGLTPADKETMGSLGMMIMDYLKISRQAHEGRRATRLSQGLSCFVEGGSSFANSIHPSHAGSPDFTSSNNVSHNTLSVRSFDTGDDPRSRSRSRETRSICSSSLFDSKTDQSNAPPGTLPPEWGSSSRRRGSPLDETNDTSRPFKRAANLLRESMELGSDGGVVFLEAGNNPILDSESGSDSAEVETGNPASVLAISTQDSPFAPEPGSNVAYPATNLERSFLLRLLRRYSKGRLWGFHRDGMLSSSDDDDSDDCPKRLDLPKGKGKWKATENKLLNRYFLNACQVLFVPLWNAGNSQWFAGCFCWNTAETRVFSPSVELSSVLGFGSSIMADYSRIQSLISDRQKGDFIGSISHELRSPLHGILAAAEFLQGTQLDEFQGSLLETVNACGRTLLDTMNQVLDFSKIVSLERTWRNIKRHKASPNEIQGMEKGHLDSYLPTDLAVLAEEVVEGVYLGHAYGKRVTASAGPPVMLPHTSNRDRDTPNPNKQSDIEVMMDIAQNDWMYRTQPGALRRILMNVLGNAMKYTDQGHVAVRLEVTESSDSRSRRGNAEDLVTLTVSDTGKGISEEFMRARLYTPFAQEDSLAVGTGLGMSIVRSLVKALNGSVNTWSRPERGTVVKVTLPMERSQEPEALPTPSPSHDDKDTLSQARLLSEQFSSRRVAILGFDPVSAMQHPMWSIVTRYMTEWYGLELVSWRPSSSNTPAVDLVLADEQILSIECSADIASPRVPAMLVLCNKPVDYVTARSQWSHLAQSVEMIRQPCGPHKLARAIRKCLETVRAAESSSSGETSTSTTPTKATRPASATTPPTETTPTERPRSGSGLSSSATNADSRHAVHKIDLTGVNVDLTPPELTTSSSDTSSSITKSPTLESELQPFITVRPMPLPLIKRAEVEHVELHLPPAPSACLERVIEQPHEHEPETAQAPAPEPGPEQEEQEQKRARVLVVDDNSINLSLMLTCMKKRTLAALDAAENGKVAVEAVERMGGYDLIFLDMSMPVMDGFEAARHIRTFENASSSSSPNQPQRKATIIALTGLSSPRDESDALACGVDLFLTKPVSFKEVSRLVDEWEEERSRERAVAA